MRHSLWEIKSSYRWCAKWRRHRGQRHKGQCLTSTEYGANITQSGECDAYASLCRWREWILKHALVQHCANNSEYSTCYLHQSCVVVSQQCHRIASSSALSCQNIRHCFSLLFRQCWTRTATELAYAEIISYNRKNLEREFPNESQQQNRQQSKTKWMKEEI